MTVGAVTILPLAGIPEVRPGDDLAGLLHVALRDELKPGDVLVVSSKVLSKAEGLVATGADRQQLVLEQSRRVVAERATATGVTRVVEALAGPVMVGAGIDGSNTGGDDILLLLPHDPDAAAARLRAQLAELVGHDQFGLVVTDTAGRPWRGGQTDFALGSAGVGALDDLRGTTDADGRPLAVTARAVADEIASAADLVKGKATGVPAAVVRGLDILGDGPDAGSLVRTGPTDWFSLGRVEAVRAALGVEAGSDLSVQVGLAPTTRDSLGERRARAVRVALVGLHLEHTLSEEGVVETFGTEAERAYAAARIEVAASAEDLLAHVDRETWRVTLTDPSR